MALASGIGARTPRIGLAADVPHHKDLSRSSCSPYTGGAVSQYKPGKELLRSASLAPVSGGRASSTAYEPGQILLQIARAGHDGQPEFRQPRVAIQESLLQVFVKHQLGLCKPCAFVHRGDSCKNGFGCDFCHFCGPGEKRRRRRNMKAQAKQMRQELIESAGSDDLSARTPEDAALQTGTPGSA
eukprot:CAMPEP_0179072550 /NCGR_PEP_ID=MMETSP0796-20121207/32113_1 /TAXON_ID=73915 /ORGANISM="Pyrodinium bahamense, Strain pbaha01" /LENGTH=184 /DNA_ID=CAMNT_0020769715 /DNA_START=45 /DNA_END=599 /DNA_ORIENTATION=+